MRTPCAVAARRHFAAASTFWHSAPSFAATLSAVWAFGRPFAISAVQYAAPFFAHTNVPAGLRFAASPPPDNAVVAFRLAASACVMSAASLLLPASTVNRRNFV